MVQILNQAFKQEWDRLTLANCRFSRLEAAMRVRALLELSEGTPTLELLELAAERSACSLPEERRSFGKAIGAAETGPRLVRSS